MADSASMTLRVLTPSGAAGEAECDSVTLVLRDGAAGQGGGSVGILRDHAPAVMALGAGLVRAVRAGKTVLLLRTEGGFASVKDNTVTVLTDSAAPEENGV